MEIASVNFEIQPDIITRWSPDAKLLYANDAFKNELKSIEGIMYEPGTSQAFPTEPNTSWSYRITQVAKTKIQANHYDCVPSAEGNFYFFTQLIPEFHEHHNQSVLAITRNITESKKRQIEIGEMNESLRVKNRQLEQYNKELVALGAVTSDQLKAPLKKIYTSIELLIGFEGAKLSDTGKAHFRRIQSAIQKMGLITDDLLSFVQLSNPDFHLNMTLIDLDVVLDEAIQSLSGTIKKTNTAIAVESLPEVRGNRFLLVWLFQHLLSNGIKFQPTAQKPEIKVTSDLVVKTASDRHIVLKEWLKISFSDNGIGFDENHKLKLFQLFSKLPGHEQFRGSGIGLAVCRKIMEIHRGSIHAESNANGGATFYCCFPPPVDRPDTDSPEAKNSVSSPVV
ncbi:MAG TPA: ATP-binding protein [Puia sp.]|nr:ATP-binding protein [Puia sp.]